MDEWGHATYEWMNEDSTKRISMPNINEIWQGITLQQKKKSWDGQSVVRLFLLTAKGATF